MSDASKDQQQMEGAGVSAQVKQQEVRAGVSAQVKQQEVRAGVSAQVKQQEVRAGVSAQVEQQQEEDTWYNVEFIVDKRLNLTTGKLEYRTRWQGYTEQDDTWEPAENLSHLQCFKDFEEGLKKKEAEGPKKRASRGRPRKSDTRGTEVSEPKRKKEEPQDTTTIAAADTSMASLPSIAADVSTTANQDRAPERVQEKVPTATVTREKDFGGDAVDDESVRELRLEEPTPGKHYKIQDGVALKKILSVASHDGRPVSLVEYKDSTYEIVPTEVLADHCPKFLIAFYEARLVYHA